MAKRRFWNGFALGAAAGAGAGVLSSLLINKFGRASEPRVLRLEKSLQIGRPVEEVFQTWSQLDQLPKYLSFIQEVRTDGNRSHWRVQINGRTAEWDAEIEQLIPNEAIGWKSLNGPKHTGRISFSRLGNDTLVHVTMNYAPPLGKMSGVLSPVEGYLEHQIDRAFREFKAALEGKGEERDQRPATGTFGRSSAEGQRLGSTYGRAD